MLFVMPVLFRMKCAAKAGLLVLGVLFSEAAQAGEWKKATDLQAGRSGSTATLLHSGELLVVGGSGEAGVLATAELVQPATGQVRVAPPLSTGRRNHAAVLLRSGRVLVLGGANGSGSALASVEIYDPVTNAWSAAASLAAARGGATATLLNDGRVLVVGGEAGGTMLASAELYDPVANSWTGATSLTAARSGHVAVVLADGQVLVAGGMGAGSSLVAAAEIYNASENTWSAAGVLATARQEASATRLLDGRVLLAAGQGAAGALNSAEVFQPATKTWSAAASLTGARSQAAAVLLPDGQVLVAGGLNAGSFLATSELYNPQTNAWSEAGSLLSARAAAVATVLPQGDVWIAGGQGSGGWPTGLERWRKQARAWQAGQGLPQARYLPGTALLEDGRVLISGGFRPGGALASASTYNETTGQWTATGSMVSPRYLHGHALLHSGRVLAFGGLNAGNAPLGSAEIYNPTAGTWTATASMGTGSYNHTSAVLWDGRVLVAGGTAGGVLSRAEVYDPLVSAWLAVAPMSAPRSNAAMVLLNDGRVLVCGGINALGQAVATAEIFNPATGTWTVTGSLANARQFHTSSLLPDGRVLVVGGSDENSLAVTACEIYDPQTGLWAGAGESPTARYLHSAAVLPGGEIMILGGLDANGESLAAVDIYDPVLQVWTVSPALAMDRYYTAVQVLPSGRVLVAGGVGTLGTLDTVELYHAGYPAGAALPLITTATVNSTDRLVINGSGFRNRPEASSGAARSSHVNHPLVRMQHLGSGQSMFVQADSGGSVSDSLFTSTPLRQFPVGHALVTVHSGGASSLGRVVFIPEPAVARLRVQQPAGSSLASGAQVNYGLVLTGQEASRTFTILNPGRADLTLAVSFTGADAGMFSVSTAPASPLAGPSGSTTLVVRYQPTQPGPRTATLRIESNDPDMPLFTATLRGTSYSSNARLAQLGVSHGTPSPVFAPDTTAYSLEVPNGISTLSVTPVAEQPGAVIRVNGSPVGSAQTSSVLPLAVGSTVITVLVTAEDGVATRTYTLTVGRSGPVEMVVDSPSGGQVADGATYDYGALLAGQTTSRTFTIRNQGSDNLTGLTVSKEGPGAGDFELTALPQAPLAGGGSTTLTVRYTAGTGGARSAWLRIVSNDVVRNPFDIQLTAYSLTKEVDVDNDGMSDAAEHRLAALGFDWQVRQDALVDTYFDNAQEAGLYQRSQLEALQVGRPLLERHPQTGQFSLTLSLYRSQDLSTFSLYPFSAPQVSFTQDGRLKFTFTPGASVMFYRLDAQ